MPLILVANPGSSSRKYGLYESEPLKLRATAHFEMTDGSLVCTVRTNESSREVPLDFDDLHDAAHHALDAFRSVEVIGDDETIDMIGLRLVAPNSYFLQDRIVDDEVVAKLEAARSLAPLHISASLDELKMLREAYAETPIVGVSDTAFHATKPPYAWNYGINLDLADKHEIKRFGYHGISVSASIDALWRVGKLPPKVIVCHLGSGSSITGVYHSRSVDTTMGYSPLEGLVMATRTGSIDYSAARALKQALGVSDEEFEVQLNKHSGLLGLGGSDDIRELLSREADGDHRAHLALDTLVHSIHKAIGGMMAAMNGCDMIVFTGTVGERSAILRRRIVAHLEFMDFILDGTQNDETTNPDKMTFISQQGKSRPIVVIPADEAREIARHTADILETPSL